MAYDRRRAALVDIFSGCPLSHGWWVDYGAGWFRPPSGHGVPEADPRCEKPSPGALVGTLYPVANQEGFRPATTRLITHSCIIRKLVRELSG